MNENKFVAATPKGRFVVVSVLAAEGCRWPDGTPRYDDSPSVSVAHSGKGIDHKTGKPIGMDHGYWFPVRDLPAVLRRIDFVCSTTPPCYPIQGL